MRRKTRIFGNKNNTGEQREEVMRSYREYKTRLGKSIKTAKEAAWKKLIQEIDHAVWGTECRVVTGKLGKEKAVLNETETGEQIKKVFPNKD
ncbi:hypothetical protein Zmor_023277 [Zophobas morio]|uniref:Uncharacterized protein n=1 Tax=Zophobas morio TaxID=2755281 RepID=A0AA38M6V3_9CUCU|nr:hypothetical protein Zmor_023277 [Zophobas morio]